MADGWDGILADVFVEILLRIPPSPRRRLRLVCRRWRDVIDEHNPEPPAHAKVLVVYKDCGSRAFVFDDLAGRSRELDLEGSGLNTAGLRMIGTCNGLLCFLQVQQDSNGNNGVVIAVANPVVGETVIIRGAPTTRYSHQHHRAYSFGYHQATGLYKLVHVPCGVDQAAELDAVRVLTLGDRQRGWREVAVPAGSSCHLRFGLATVDGVTYWSTRDGDRIMSFDLGDERAAAVESAPLVPPPLLRSEAYMDPCHLTVVRGRLGLAVRRPDDEFNRHKTEIWVLEGESEEERTWVKRYTVLAHGSGLRRQEIALPHVVHDEYVLTTGEALEYPNMEALEAHRPRDERKMRPCGMVRVGAPKPETTAGMFEGWRCISTFAYVETKEPLFVYCDSESIVGED